LHRVDLPRLLLGPVFLHAPWLLKWLPVERVQKSAKALGLIQARFREIYAHKSQESVDIDDTDLLSTLSASRFSMQGLSDYQQLKPIALQMQSTESATLR
jgi:hypothetical protein